MTVADVLRTRRHVLLDFDGPVCAVFGGLPAEEVARRLWGAVGNQAHDGADTPSTDPLALLGVIASLSPDVLVDAERKLRDLEVDAVRLAPPTPSAFDALRALRRAGHSVVIVSNNSVACVETFLDAHGLRRYVDGLSCRAHSDPALLKPSPYLLEQAMKEHDSTADQTVMIGDSATDIDAARAAGVAVIAYANKPDKIDLFDEYRPDALIEDMAALGTAVAMT